MADEINHPLVDLMLERMKTHPEEFEGEGNRWNDALVAIHQWAAPEQKEQVDRALGDIMLDEAHRDALDELLNGEQRRAEAKAEQAAKDAALQQAIQQAKQQMAQQMQGDINNHMLNGLSVHRGNNWTAMDQTSILQPTSLKLGGETLDEGMIKRMKKVLGL
jgi:uncharacterized damage-inducible protein DinB